MSDHDEQRQVLWETPWTTRDMVLACVGVLSLMAVSVLGLALIVGIAGATGVRLSAATPGLVWATLALEALFVIPAWRRGPGRYGGGWQALGLRRPRSSRALSWLALGLPALLTVNGVWALVAQHLEWARQAEILPLLGGGWRGLAVGLVLAGIVAPFAEEVFFRGYLYAGMRARRGPAVAGALSAAVFAVSHMQPGVMLPIFAMGAILAFVYERSRSLWVPIVLHGLVNAFALVAAFVAAGA